MKIYSFTLRNDRKAFNKVFSFLLILFIIFIVFLIILKTFVFKLDYFDIVSKEAELNNLDPYLIMSIIKVESKFDKNAVSYKEAKGLMQIMDNTATDINNKHNVINEFKSTAEIFEEEKNIALGCKYFSTLLDRYNNNWYIAICAYNAGMGNVDKWLSEGIIDREFDSYISNDIPFKQTKEYLKKVIYSYHIYKILY